MTVAVQNAESDRITKYNLPINLVGKYFASINLLALELRPIAMVQSVLCPEIFIRFIFNFFFVEIVGSIDSTETDR